MPAGIHGSMAALKNNWQANEKFKKLKDKDILSHISQKILIQF